jgi:pyruvate, water dikinase
VTPPPLPLAAVTDARAYGGKAAALGTAVRAGLPVPPGVALPGLLVELLDRSQAARDVVRTVAGELGGPLAARSSAADEDGTRSSFAGQHLTVLNLRTAEETVDAVARVAASARSPSAMAYRRLRGAEQEPCCGVVLQRLVPASVAGVLFSRNPVTGDDELLVEASWSLGEAVVDGLVTPDLYRLDRSGALLEQTIGTKDRAVVPRPRGGTDTVPVPADRVHRPCLDAGHLLALAALARRCDEVFGGPSDLEWALAGDDLALLQRRPITTAAV